MKKVDARSKKVDAKEKKNENEISLTYGKMLEFTNNKFLASLVQKSALPWKIALEVAYILKEIEEHIDVFNKTREKIQLKYVELDKDGKPIVEKMEDGRQRVKFKTAEDEGKFVQEVTEIINQEVKLKSKAIDLSEITSDESSKERFSIVEVSLLLPLSKQ